MLVSGYSSIDLVWTASSAPGPNRTAILTGPVEPERRFGGCGPIAAMRLARQGHQVGLVSWLGDDEHGRAYRTELESAGVDLAATVFARGEASPRSLLIYDPDGGVTCCYHPSGSAAQTLNSEAERQLHQVAAVAITVGPPQLTSAVLERRRRETMLAWDVKADPIAFPLDLRAQLLREAHLITMNRDELAFPVGDSGEAAMIQRLRAAMWGVLAITSGQAGARIIWPDGEVQVPATPVANVDPTGAGDAFFAGLLSALLRQLDPIAAGKAAVAEAENFLRETNSR